MWRCGTGLAGLLGLSLGLPLSTWLLTGMQHALYYGVFQIEVAAYISGLGVALIVCGHLLRSVLNVRNYVDAETAQVDLKRLWREQTVLADAGFVVFLLLMMNLALSGVAVIAEIYRQTAENWHDAELWALEAELFARLKASPFPALSIFWWEWVYQLMWVYVLSVLGLQIIVKREFAAVSMIAEAILVFYAAHLFALFLPTAGPALFRPQDFPWLEGTLTAQLQVILSAYQQGDLAQSGVMYGLEAFPSVHIALTWLASRHLLRWRPAWWPLAVWVLMNVWISTVVLGWHYMVDGWAGILCAEAACRISQCSGWKRTLGKTAVAQE